MCGGLTSLAANVFDNALISCSPAGLLYTRFFRFQESRWLTSRAGHYDLCQCMLVSYFLFCSHVVHIHQSLCNCRVFWALRFCFLSVLAFSWCGLLFLYFKPIFARSCYQICINASLTFCITFACGRVFRSRSRLTDALWSMIWVGCFCTGADLNSIFVACDLFTQKTLAFL